MVTLSPELEAEIRRRAAEADLPSPEALLREALDALDREQAFEKFVLAGLEGEAVSVTEEDTEEIFQAGLAKLRELKGE